MVESGMCNKNGSKKAKGCYIAGAKRASGHVLPMSCLCHRIPFNHSLITQIALTFKSCNAQACSWGRSYCTKTNMNDLDEMGFHPITVLGRGFSGPAQTSSAQVWE